MRNWYKNYDNAKRDAEKENCSIVIGSNDWTDIYYLIPNDAKPGIITLSSRSQKNGSNRFRIVYKSENGELTLIENASGWRISKVQQGAVAQDKIVDYLFGYYTLAEERSEKIRQRKEAARISHDMCDMEGKEGHDERQKIRRKILSSAK